MAKKPGLLSVRLSLCPLCWLRLFAKYFSASQKKYFAGPPQKGAMARTVQNDLCRINTGRNRRDNTSCRKRFLRHALPTPYGQKRRRQKSRLNKTFASREPAAGGQLCSRPVAGHLADTDKMTAPHICHINAKNNAMQNLHGVFIMPIARPPDITFPPPPETLRPQAFWFWSFRRRRFVLQSSLNFFMKTNW